MVNSAAKIGLGSAQWGMDYGVANAGGEATSEEVAKILCVAKDQGISVIDTAPTYGEAETKIGKQSCKSFSIVTKTPHFQGEVISDSSIAELRRSFHDSRRFLRRQRLHGYLLHNAEDLLKSNGAALWKEMQTLKENKLVEKIGLSIYTAEQLNRILDLCVPDIIQLPINVFDQRLILDGSLATLKGLGVEIHARSALLQGLLSREEASLPGYFRPWSEHINKWHLFCESINVPPVHVAIAFVCNIQEVDVCLLGVETSAQLISALTGLNNTPSFDASSLAVVDSRLLNPSCWGIV